MKLSHIVSVAVLSLLPLGTVAQTKVTEAEIKNLFLQAIHDKRIVEKDLEGVDGCDCMPYEYNSSIGSQALLSYCPQQCTQYVLFYPSPERRKWTDKEREGLKNNLLSPSLYFTR